MVLKNLLLFFFISISIILLGLGVQACFHMGGELWAAWIQAVGSVVAILVAIFAPMWQEEYRRRERMVNVLRGLRSVTKNANKMARLLKRRLGNLADMERHRRDISKNHLKPLLYVLDKVDVADVTACKCVGILLNLQSYTLRLSEIWDEISVHGQAYPNRIASKKFCSRAVTKLSEVDGFLDAKIKRIQPAGPNLNNGDVAN